MFDTMTVTKVTGAVCGSLLVFMLGGWAAETLYHVGGEGHGEMAQAYTIDTGAGEEAAPAEDAAAVDFSVVLASADAGAGEKVFAKCKACHKLDGSQNTGPHLNGVVNRGKAQVADFAYSDAIKAVADQAWSPENLNGFLTNPKGYMPGTKMAFAGLPKVEDRANLIAYLETTKE